MEYLIVLQIGLNEHHPPSSLPILGIRSIHWHDFLIPILGIHPQSHPYLLQIGGTSRCSCLFPCPTKNGEENCRQNRDDSYDDEQLY